MNKAKAHERHFSYCTPEHDVQQGAEMMSQARLRRVLLVSLNNNVENFETNWRDTRPPDIVWLG